jgi:hypothetical protein
MNTLYITLINHINLQIYFLHKMRYNSIKIQAIILRIQYN